MSRVREENYAQVQPRILLNLHRREYRDWDNSLYRMGQYDGGEPDPTLSGPSNDRMHTRLGQHHLWRAGQHRSDIFHGGTLGHASTCANDGNVISFIIHKNSLNYLARR